MNNFFDFNGGKIHYTCNGEGKPVVLLHGFLESLNIWKDFEEKLSKTYKVVAIDLPGHGESSNYGSRVTMEIMADAVKQLLQLLNIEKSIIIGHSMGGYVSLAFVRDYPNMAVGLGLFHSHAASDSAEAKINRGRAIKVVEENHIDFIAAFIPDLFCAKYRQDFNAEILLLQDDAKKMKKNGIIGALSGMRERHDCTNLLKSTQLPIMFIIGKNDIRSPKEAIMNQIFMPKNSHILILEDVAHMGFIEAFDETSNFLNSFINECYLT